MEQVVLDKPMTPVTGIEDHPQSWWLQLLRPYDCNPTVMTQCFAYLTLIWLVGGSTQGWRIQVMKSQPFCRPLSRKPVFFSYSYLSTRGYILELQLNEKHDEYPGGSIYSIFWQTHVAFNVAGNKRLRTLTTGLPNPIIAKSWLEVQPQNVSGRGNPIISWFYPTNHESL